MFHFKIPPVLKELKKVESHPEWFLILFSRAENSFHYEIMCPVPLPKCILVFTQGNWAQYTEETVVDINFMEGASTIKKLGSLSSKNR
jgi:hypothetical protein